MKKILIAALAALTMTVGSVAYAAEPIHGTVTEVRQIGANLEKTVRVYGDNYLIGTGFFIEGGYIITAEHSFRLHKPKTLTFEDGTGAMGFAELVKLDPTLDLAILKTDTYKEHKYFELASYPDLTEVTIIGNPANEQFAERTGHVRSLNQWITIGVLPDYPVLSTARRIITSAESVPGFSGGPALQHDKVIGVVIGGAAEGQAAMSIIVRLEDLKSFIEGAIGDEAP